MTGLRLGCAAVISIAGLASAQQQVSINLTGVKFQNGLNQSRSSSPNTISPAFRYHYVISGMVQGSGIVMGSLFPSPTPLAQALETLSPGASAFLTGDFDNCSGTHPIAPPPQTTAGSQVLAGITVNYSLTIGFQIDAANIASFNLTNVVLTPSALVGTLTFTTGSAVISRVYLCQPNCDNSTSNPVLNVADFTCFLQKFAAADPTANCDCSTATPVLNVADFTCFLQKFAGGCPPP